MRLLLAHGGGIQSFLTDFDTMSSSAVLRMLETVASAAPYLVIGLLAAGILRGLVGPARLHAALDAGAWTGPLRAWALGTLLPVCALGALPVAYELKRARIAGGTVLTFLLAAPLLNPITLLYGISILPLSTLLYFVCGTALISVGIGGIWNTRIEPPRAYRAADESLEWPPARTDLRLAVAGGTAAVTGFSQTFLLDFLLVILGMGLAGALMPYALFQATLTPHNPWSPLVMALAGVLFYANPTEAMRVVGLSIRDGFSIGAAFSFLMIGAGTVVATVNGVRREVGWRRAGQLACLLLLSTLALAYAADFVLPRSWLVTQSHTHAFDGFTRLSTVPSESGLAGLVESVWQRLPLYERLGFWTIGGLLMAGSLLKLGGARTDAGRLMRSTRPETAPTSASSKWNPALTPTQLSVGALVAAGLLSLGGLYLYYPPAAQIFGDLDNLRFDVDEAIRRKNQDETVARIDEFRELAARLPVSVFLHKGSVAPAQRDRQRELIYSLDTLDEFVKEKQFEEAKAALRYLMDSYDACRKEYSTNRT